MAQNRALMNQMGVCIKHCIFLGEFYAAHAAKYMCHQGPPSCNDLAAKQSKAYRIYIIRQDKLIE